MPRDEFAVGFVPIYAYLGQCAVEQPTRRADERMSLLVPLIAGLFADQHDSRFGRARAEYGPARCGRCGRVHGHL